MPGAVLEFGRACAVGAENHLWGLFRSDFCVFVLRAHDLLRISRCLEDLGIAEEVQLQLRAPGSRSHTPSLVGATEVEEREKECTRLRGEKAALQAQVAELTLQVSRQGYNDHIDLSTLLSEKQSQRKVWAPRGMSKRYTLSRSSPSAANMMADGMMPSLGGGIPKGTNPVYQIPCEVLVSFFFSAYQMDREGRRSPRCSFPVVTMEHMSRPRLGGRGGVDVICAAIVPPACAWGDQRAVLHCLCLNLRRAPLGRRQAL